MFYKTAYLISSALALVYLARLDHYGIYLAIALFWIISTFYKPLILPAIWSVVIFMLAFALIRIFNIGISGISNPYYLFILFGEILIALTGLRLIR
mgnify:CR=1 FL=1|tara:strand:- start:419 stop:706 length:288 start_codon:yes stop_codon:yes gene_type:complete